MSPEVLYLSSPQGSCQKTPDPLFQEQGMDLGLSAEPAPQATLAGPFLSAPPTLERVTEHQAGIFNSTMPTCDNEIPTSFLPWLKSGEERGQEAVTTSIFPQSDPSLTSHQSAVPSQCPCSFFSCSVTKQSQVVYLQRFLRRDTGMPVSHRALPVCAVPPPACCVHQGSFGRLSLVSSHTTWLL